MAFDVPYQDYSWMAYLARAGFDVFAVDLTGYGRSTRPPAMNDPCNLAAEQQSALIPTRLPAMCTPSYPYELTTMTSEWDDIDAVVEYVRTLRHVDRISMVAWSRGGPRAGGYALRHPEKVQKLVLLAPRYPTPSGPPAKLPAPGVAMNTQSREEFTAEWDSQVGCPKLHDTAVRDAIWTKMLESDSVGAAWGRGVRRAPVTTLWGWNSEAAAKVHIPTLLVAGAHDNRVAPERVRELYGDLGSRQKVFIDLGCSSHNALWERSHLFLFRASLEWLTQGAVNGTKAGILQMGY
jgi:pimeloyl-ACP methyl ester carboxylesterase